MKKLLVPTLALIALSCGEEERCHIPYATVSFILYLDLPQDNPSLNNGYIIRSGRQAGYRGVIVVQNGDVYRAFELAAPLGFDESCGMLEVASDNMRLKNPCNGAEFMLINGMPLDTGNTVSPCPLKEYRCSYDASRRIVSVYN